MCSPGAGRPHLRVQNRQANSLRARGPFVRGGPCSSAVIHGPSSIRTSTSAIGAATPQDVAQGDNRGRYSNPQFDSLLAQASSTQDDAKRNDLYKQAEKIAIGDDLALIPLWARQQSRLVNTAKFANIKFDFYENPTLATITLK